MSKKFYRFFGGFLNHQEAWLNKMAKQGYRLLAVHKLCYEFEKSESIAYAYCVDFIAEKGKSDAQDYVTFLEDVGCNVFYKSINLNYSVGKVKLRPWAKKSGRIATKQTTFDKELLIVEIPPHVSTHTLHTSLEDKRMYYKQLQKPWTCMFLLICLLSILHTSLTGLLLSIPILLPIILYQKQIHELKKEARVIED